MNNLLWNTLSGQNATLWEALFNSLWQGLIIVAAVWALLQVFPRLNAATRYAAWYATLLAVAILPFFSGRFAGPQAMAKVDDVTPRQVTTAVPQTFPTVVPTHKPVVRADSRVVRRPALKPTTVNGVVPARSATTTARLAEPPKPRPTNSPAIPENWAVRVNGGLWLFVVGAVWLLGAAWKWARLALSIRRIRAIKSRAIVMAAPGGTWPEGLARVRRGRRVWLGWSDEIQVPGVFGFVRPAILFPRRLEGELTASEMEQVALHELAHISRFDDWWQVVQRMIEGVLFFHPAIRFVSQRLALEREIACDDWVLHRVQRPREYASCLARLAEHRSLRPLPVPGAALSKKHIVRRIEMLMSTRRNSRPGSSRLVTALATLMLAVAIVQIGFVRPLVAVTPKPAAPMFASSMAGSGSEGKAEEHWAAAAQKAATSARSAAAAKWEVPSSWSYSAHSAAREARAEAIAATEVVHIANAEAVRAIEVAHAANVDAIVRVAKSEAVRAIEVAHAASVEAIAAAEVAHSAATSRASEPCIAYYEATAAPTPTPEARATRHTYAASPYYAEASTPAPAPPAAPSAPGAASAPSAPSASIWSQRGGPTTPETPTPPATPEPPVRRKGFDSDRWDDGTNLTINNDGDETTWIWSDSNHKIRVEMDGTVQFNAKGSALKSISKDGYFIVSERHHGRTRELEIVPGRADSLEYYYFEDDDSKPYDAAAQNWFSELLPMLMRETGVGAKERVASLYDAGGTPAVLEEIDLISSDYVKRLYFVELLNTDSLSQDEVRSIFQAAGQHLDSDYEMAELLIEYADLVGGDAATVDAFVEAVGHMESDYEIRRVLTELAEREELTPAYATAVLKLAAQMESDYEKAELLLQLAEFSRDDATMRDLYLDAVASMDSDYEKRRVLEELLETRHSDEAFVSKVLSVASTIGSDYERAELLIHMADLARDHDGSLSTYIQAVGEIDSDYEARRALTAMSWRDDMPESVCIELLDAVSRFDSDYEKAEFLVDHHEIFATTDKVRDAFDRTLDTIGSDYERNRVEAAFYRSSRKSSSREGSD